MAIEGCDYSYDRPDLACLASKGMQFVVRYTSATASKNMTPAEVQKIRDAGMRVVTVWQEGKSTMLQGYDRGVLAAQEARQIAGACGMPANRPVYFALDTDPNVLTTAQWVNVKGFLDGAASVIGRANVGVYGGLKAIETLCPTYAPWGWQTKAWSGGVWSAKAQLQQYIVWTSTNPVELCGGAIDYDRATVADYGQWGNMSTTPMTASQWLAQAKKWGVKLNTTRHPDWATHNRNSVGLWGPVYGTVIHNTGSTTEMPIVDYCYTGDPARSLPGPLAEGVILDDGTCYMIGWGRANTQGKGDSRVLAAMKTGATPPFPPKYDDTDGNRYFYGWEFASAPWNPFTAAQFDTAVRIACAIMDFHGWTSVPGSVIGHFQWTYRKPQDPDDRLTADASAESLDWPKYQAAIKARLAAGPTGEDMPLTAAEKAEIAKLTADAVWYRASGLTNSAGAAIPLWAILRDARASVFWNTPVNRVVDGVPKQIPAIQELADAKSEALGARADLAAVMALLKVVAEAPAQDAAAIAALVVPALRAAVVEALADVEVDAALVATKVADEFAARLAA